MNPLHCSSCRPASRIRPNTAPGCWLGHWPGPERGHYPPDRPLTVQGTVATGELLSLHNAAGTDRFHLNLLDNGPLKKTTTTCRSLK